MCNYSQQLCLWHEMSISIDFGNIWWCPHIITKKLLTFTFNLITYTLIYSTKKYRGWTDSLGGAVFTDRDTDRQTNDKERVAVFFLKKIRQQKIVVIFLDFDNLKDIDDIFILSHLKIKLKMTELIWPLYLLTVISNYNEILREMEYGYYIESYSRIFSYRINALRI